MAVQKMLGDPSQAWADKMKEEEEKKRKEREETQEKERKEVEEQKQKALAEGKRRKKPREERNSLQLTVGSGGEEEGDREEASG
jgi:hypothetical protein